MAFWEFLIQKEGDRSWLPLESPTVEILEGRYRVVARSSRIHAPVEIRVIQNVTAETPPVRRIQKRLSQTNQDGLMVVIPFTRLVPGEWELRCGGDVMSDMMGEGWLYRVQLQVLPIDLEATDDDTLDDWEPEWRKEAAIAPSETAPAAQAPQISQGTELPQDKELTEDKALSQSLPESQPDLPVSKLDGDSSFSAPVLQISLERETYIVQRGLPLVLSGQVLSGQVLSEQALSEESQPLEEATIADVKLRVRLFDPQTSRMLVDETQILAQAAAAQLLSSERSLSLAFSITLALPSDCETHLLLGELALYGAAEESLPPVLATQSFSVTTDLLELLEAIANNFSEPEPAAPVTKASVPVATVPAPFIQFRPAIQQALPPLLRLPDPEKEPRRSLELPLFAEAQPEAQPDAQPDAQPEVAVHQPSEPPSEPAIEPLARESEVESAAITSEAKEPEANLLSNPSSELQPQLKLIDEAGDPASDWQRVEGHVPLWQRPSTLSDLPPELPQTPADSAFRALNLQERFLERLQALAADPELADWLSDMAEPSDGDSSTVTGVLDRRSQDRAIGLDAELSAQEIVVDEPFFISDRPQAGQNSTYSAAAPAASPKTSSSTTVLTETVLPEEPIAMPQLTVPTGELIAGQTVEIIIKIPGTYARIYVKLWTHDRQSRTLLDGPHWLMDFSPDGFGNLVSKTQIMVPFGCLEVQLEAIAIDITTQFESDKVSIIRSVIPPDLNVIPVVL
jgi:hypothetical protein